MMSSERNTPSFIQRVNQWEQFVSGKPLKRISKHEVLNKTTSIACLSLSILAGIVAVNDEIGNSGGIAPTGLLFSIAAGFAMFLLSWCILISVLKGTIFKSTFNALLGIIAASSIMFLCHWLLEFILIEARWGVVWASRVQLFAGHEMNFFMAVEGQTNQMWRLWSSLFVLTSTICIAYGTSGITARRFGLYYTALTLILISFAWYPENQNYEPFWPIVKICGCSVLGLVAFMVSRWYCERSEEFQINKLKKLTAILGIFTFFFSLFVMNPPDSVVERGLMEEGIEPALWGGLFVNLVLATAGGVLGLGIGVILAFGRQSKLPIFKWPSTMLIEIVRAGPMVAWLYFAKYLLEDVIVPFSDADSIMRTLFMFAFFGGCYTAEILRGGIQSINSGQIEAATALGMNPNQIKTTVILPNAVRTTLPSLVSLLIGLWKDTTLIFIIGIFDFFKIAKDLPTTDLEFALDIMEPLYLAAFVFWIIAFYLSRISLGIEKNLGLKSTTGGEMT